ncbi:MAG: hypothetical protein HXL58_01655 [Solobacterium sp.]|nr:hypothetical protein [Solobacterium sp.]
MLHHILTIAREGGASGGYSFGFDAMSVVSGMFSVIKENIGPILTLMGITLGAAWVVKYFKHARKGKI